MIKVENIETWGFEHAIRGMRNPLNSWSRSDSRAGEPDCFENCGNCTLGEFFVGENDLKLMRQLYVGGQPHRKYLRQIFAVMDITAPMYWWKEFDTYKVGTTANSCSTMHKFAECSRCDEPRTGALPRRKGQGLLVADDSAPPVQLQSAAHGHYDLRECNEYARLPRGS